ncbi:MAG: 1-acyl-sn-glycerol-3-phosphate acyltransferase [Proteobacteria bacterium]|nr:1-acyl-sn-glycerol-3-phosphate acyltransferase [Pseudomonadota bacterium]MBI3499041.1 1-acyl-sn-glycerol-3-phosphate acyltransferase [Pseudomonadota bacterium]
MPDIGSTALAAWRALAYVLWTLMLMPLQVLAVAAGWRLAERLPLFYHRSCLPLLGVSLRVLGQMVEARPVLFACNHTSYLDIPILGALIPGSFVAKSEIAGWPLFGTLARLQRSVFVNRRRSMSSQHRDEMSERLARGDNIILFPEGTSSDGNRVLPFKSALFAAAEGPRPGRTIVVQPVSVAFVRLNGMPLGREFRPLYAWYGDMGLLAHAWFMLGLGMATVEIRFHPATSLDEQGSRKALAHHCHRLVAAGLAESLAGARAARPQIPEAAPVPAEPAVVGS